MPYVVPQSLVYTSIPAHSISGSAGAATTGVVLPANAGRKIAFIQVLGSGSPLYVAYNNRLPGQNNCDVLLKAASSDFGTDGGVLVENNYVGDISVSGAAGCTFSCWYAV